MGYVFFLFFIFTRFYIFTFQNAFYTFHILTLIHFLSFFTFFLLFYTFLLLFFAFLFSHHSVEQRHGSWISRMRDRDASRALEVVFHLEG